MTTSIKIFCEVNEALEKVAELRKANLVQGKDFDFAYNQSRWDEMIGEIPKTTIFTFYNDKHAVFYSLKWN
jgi:hypothetical protein